MSLLTFSAQPAWAEMPGLEADGQLRMTEDGTILDPSAMTEKEGSIPENREH